MIGGGFGMAAAPLKAPLIFGWYGDSLAKGAGDNPYPVAQPDIKILKTFDGSVSQGIDPFGDNLGALFSGAHPFATTLRSIAPDRTIIMCNVGRAGSEAVDWIPGSAYYLELIAAINLALTFTNGTGKIGCLWAMLGNNNAVSSVKANAFLTDFPAITTDLQSVFAGKFLNSSHCIGLSQLCASPPGPPYTAWDTAWAQMRTNIASLASSSLLVVTPPDGPWVDGNPGLHPQTSCYQIHGADVASQWATLVSL